ncbi:MAG: methylenetetrahydrofolate reductase [Candidatus Thorarchaeota archaeon]|nr:methylenetetrahydrofolate reductase [Candidatus Thorarchaeota archaeon]
MHQSHLEKLLHKGEFVVTGEVTAPHGTDVEILQERIRIIKDYCDAINVTDNPRGIPSLSNIACAHFVIKEGAEPVLQMTGRDRNRILFQSDLYGAYALGVRNVVFITGDTVLMGTQPLTKMVFDVDSTQALDLTRLLMEGYDLGGEELVGSPNFFLGATFNPTAQPFEIQARRIQEKINNGAKFFQTQAIYELEPFAALMEDVREMETWTLAGIIPLRTSEMAETMNNKVPGIRVPEEMVSRLRDAEDGLEDEERELASRKVGLEIALETIEGVKRIDGVSGIHLMGIGWEESIPELVKNAGLAPRPNRG